ncbi:MAG: TolB family protein [Thiothrix sp.]|nr:TolB family protein [Thiothrix sp.]HPE60561.1 hypothetical protein [Thiolinea sp.]
MKSHLAVYDLATRSYQDLLIRDGLFEAPNWTPDGQTLIVNSNGLLYRVPQAAPALIPIDTGFATRLNNDHGIAPDGSRLIICDKTEHGKSSIYWLPLCGGTPQPVTAWQPSWWHGWSPDGTMIAYAAQRGTDPTIQIYTCPLAGGAETCLTRGFTHCDGPDYSPDGQWIWFNGERDGAMQLWRMHPDGSRLMPMTQDERVNWFPHPAPDGQHVLYLSYEPGTSGHPAGLPVQLRLLAADGGEPEVLANIRGGQGSINTPCWAPDSRHFAFCHYPEL